MDLSIYIKRFRFWWTIGVRPLNISYNAVEFDNEQAERERDYGGIACMSGIVIIWIGHFIPVLPDVWASAIVDMGAYLFFIGALIVVLSDPFPDHE